MKIRTYLYILLPTLLGFSTGYSQDYRQQLETAAGHHSRYEFDKAIQICNGILAARPDSTLKTETDSIFNMEVYTQLVKSENGRSMLQFASEPTLVAKKVFPLPSFFLNLPGFGDNSWKTPPAGYTKEGAQGIFNAMNFPADAKVMVFSAQDESGAWNIMHSTKLNDTLWSAPQIANENITTAGDEILPHLSPCGKKLYFASNGHTGMGGYDLYVSQWNEETGDWDTAQNLGFPFSSTANDYFYYDTPDNSFTVFISDRENKEGEVTAYVTLHEVFPLKKGITQEEAAKMSTLPSGTAGKSTPASPKEVSNAKDEHPQYTQAAQEIKGLQERLGQTIAALDTRRARYAATADSLKRVAMEPDMLLLEKEILSLNGKISQGMEKLQEMELELLAQGITVEHDSFEPQETATIVQETQPAEFSFIQSTLGEAPQLTFEVIEPAMDLSFKISDVAVIADLSELPKGLVYHIQLMTTNKKASLKSLKGFSPVFERKVSSGKYTYSVGVFHTYAEALKNLNTVRRKGFPTAMITAYNDGKSVGTKNARIIEKQDNSIYRVTIGGYDVLPAEALAAIRENTSRDIAKANINGVMKYVIGPFANKSQADALANALLARQVSGVEIEKLENK